MFAYIHSHCGKPAFLIVEMPKPFAQAQSANARHLDGRRIKPGEATICESCGDIVWHLSTKNVRPLNERQLVSRNKREGWFTGRNYKGKASRSRNYRLGQDVPWALIVIVHPDLHDDLSGWPPLRRGFGNELQGNVGTIGELFLKEED